MNFNDIWMIHDMKIGPQEDFFFKFYDQANGAINSSLALGYGHNGSGKSTIGKELENIGTSIRENKPESMDHLLFTFKDDSHGRKKIAEIPGKEYFSNLHVFNRDFVMQHIDFHDSEGFEAIVMFGGDAEDFREINRLVGENGQLIIDIEKLIVDKEGISKEIKDEVIKVEREYIKEILNLQKSRNFEAREIEYRKMLTKNGEVNSITPDMIESQLITLKEIRQKKKKKPITLSLPNVPCFTIESSVIFENIPQPILSEREEKIVELIKMDKGYTSWLSQGERLVNKVENHCPLCFSEIEKDTLINKVGAILNPAAEKFREDLRNEMKKIRIFIIEIEELGKEYWNANELKDTLTQTEKFRETVDKSVVIVTKQLNSLLQLFNSRNENIYLEINSVEYHTYLHSISDEIKNINEEVEKLKSIIVEYNQSISQATEAELKIRNQVLKSSESYILQIIQPLLVHENTLHQNIIILKNEYAAINIRIDMLRMKSRNPEYCLELINRELAFIFCSTDKMQLELEPTNESKEIRGYRILVDGRAVSKKELSTGEQNILALIYFFKTLNRNKEIGAVDIDPLFVVLDDPVSSLDENNIVGLLSYIKCEIDEIQKNENNKVLILTHRWYVFDSIRKFYIGKAVLFEIEREDSQTVQKFMGKKGLIKGYRELLNDVLQYALEAPTNMNHTIGNILRRSMEAYFTFNYRLGFEVGLSDPLLLEKISESGEDAIVRGFISNFARRANRLILNSESHYGDDAGNIGREFESINFSSNEKQQLCKGWISFLFLLDEIHLMKQLGLEGENWDEQTVKTRSWISEIGGFGFPFREPTESSGVSSALDSSVEVIG